MQERHRISLNAVRVFAIVARSGSLTAAAAELHVTAGAVSRQLKKLEDELGVRLFRRGSNTLSITEAGHRFHQEVAPSIGLIERAADALYRDETAISVQASTSLAVRWLIPSLERFRALCPSVRVRVETGPVHGLAAVSEADISIRYFLPGEAVDDWTFLCRDMRRPVASPHLRASGRKNRKTRLPDLPALQCTAGNRDWRLWCETFAIPLDELSFTHAFDTDDAALHACVAGLGMMLAPPLLTARDIGSGALIALPGHGPVETGTYRYLRRSEARAVRQFCHWLEAEMRDLEQGAVPATA